MSKSPAPSRRAYGTGTLQIVGRSWIGAWYVPDGRRVRRKVGDVRTEGRSDGLTKAQAERALRRMRELDSPPVTPGAERVTMEQAGARVLPALGAEGPAQEVPSDDRRVRSAQSHRAVLCGQDPGSSGRRHRALHRSEAQDAGGQDHPQSPHHDPLRLRHRAARGLVRDEPGQARRSAHGRRNQTRIQFLDQAELEQLLATTIRTTRSGGSSRRST